jgi:hypothetical protein
MQTVRIIVATVALAAMVITNTTAANSITYIVGNWQINDIGQMVGSEDYGNGRLYRGVFRNPQGQAFGLPPLAGVDPVFGPIHVYGHGINNLGQMVGASNDGAASTTSPMSSAPARSAR